jgi:Tfp pilus assembly protein PilN
MTPINLLPPSLKRKQEKQVLELQMLPGILFLVGIAVILSLIWVVLNFNLGAKQARLNELNSRWSKIEKDIKRLEELRLNKANLKKRAQFINRALGSEVHWAELLNRLSDALPDGVWFTNISIKTKSGASRELKITGRAVSLGDEEMVELIERFVKNLSEMDIFSRNFSDIKLGALNRIKVGEWDTMKFELTSKMY